MLDEMDSKVVRFLTAHGRATWSELAQQLNLSAPAAADRVRRLEERGVIQGYAALVNPDAVGCHLTAFITATLDHPRSRADFLAGVTAAIEVVECHHVAGEYDYLLKVRCRDTKHLDDLLTSLKEIPGLVRTRTTIVLSSLKEWPGVPL